MIKKILGLLRKERKPARPFSAWQIELTTRCPLLCRMCIRSECAEWLNQDMPLEDFQKLLPYLKEVETVVLEGWGESLLHPDLAECIRLVKLEGCRVGFVTSGKGLTAERVAGLVAAGLDFVGFSIAGTTPETHNAIRVHSRLPEIQRAIRLFREQRERQGAPGPEIHLIYLMLKDNLHELPSVPAFAKEAGLDEVVITNICHTINRWQQTQRVFVWEDAQSPYEAVLEQTEANAHRQGVRIRKPELSAYPAPVCAENPLRNLYISCTGEVSPCVYLYPPLPSPFRRIFCDRETAVEKLSFGNIFREPFAEIWNSPGYREFRARFVEREKAYLEECMNLRERMRRNDGETKPWPEPPLPCRSCHKILGI